MTVYSNKKKTVFKTHLTAKPGTEIAKENSSSITWAKTPVDNVVNANIEEEKYKKFRSIKNQFLKTFKAFEKVQFNTCFIV